MIAGIVCEYNPFHNGHLYHINKTRENGADYIVCVMSGNFVQRGECAYFDKWLRAKTAVLCGADVVIDLPVPWSLSSAENFAKGAVSLLCGFGIDVLSFGSETDNIELLKKCADISTDEKVGERLRSFMGEGMSYPSALFKAVSELYGDEMADIISTPNSTLAVEYIKALKMIAPQKRIMPILRKGAEHDSDKIQERIASAGKIRAFVNFENACDYMPEQAYELYINEVSEGYGICRTAEGERAILSALKEMKKEEFQSFVTDEAGLAQRIYKSVKTAKNLDELYENAKSKNYTLSKVRREIMSLYLRINKSFSKEKPPYMKLLAVSEKGLKLLSSAKENSSVPIITRHSETYSFDGFARDIYELQCSSSDKFTIFSKVIRPSSMEQNNSVIIVK